MSPRNFIKIFIILGVASCSGSGSMSTDEDIEIYKAKRKKIWDEAQAKRLEVEKFMRENPGVNNTKRRRKRRTKVS